MPIQPERATRAGAYRLIRWQVVVISVIAIAMYVFFGTHVAYSAFCGGFVCIVANAYFAWKLFRVVSPRAVSRIVRAFYLGEVGKLLLTALLFVVAIKYLNVQILPFLAAYIATQSVLWFAMLFNLNDRAYDNE